MDQDSQNIFPGQKPDEKILLFVRRDWISFLPTILISLVMIIVPIIVMISIIYGLKVHLNSTIVNYLILAVSGFILFVLTFFIVGWIDYYFDVLIITNERLVNIEQNGLFNRHISELDLLRVQNVSTSIKGISQTLFNYGCVVVQTAGEMGTREGRASDFTMEAMPDPNKITRTILRAHQDLITRRGQTTAASRGEGEIYPEADKISKDSSEISQTEKSKEDFDHEEENLKVVINKTASEKTPEELPEKLHPIRVTDEGQLKEGEIIDL